jgi:hypothetical protein
MGMRNQALYDTRRPTSKWELILRATRAALFIEEPLGVA